MNETEQDLGLRTGLEALQTVLGSLAGMQVLEIGSGEGKLAEILAGSGASVTGIDPFGPDVPWTAAGSGRYRLLRTSAEAIPLGDGAVDAALFVFSLHHVPAEILPAILHEVARALRPGGRLYVAEPVADGPQHSVTRLFHDETKARAEAAKILGEQAGLFHGGEHRRLRYFDRRTYSGFEQYAARMTANMRFNGYSEAEVRAEPVRQRFETVFAQTAGKFDQPVRIDLLTR